MQKNVVADNLHAIRVTLEGSKLVQIVKYLKDNQEDFVEALKIAENEMHQQFYYAKTDYQRGYDDAMELLEKEGKVVVINNYCGPTA